MKWIVLLLSVCCSSAQLSLQQMQPFFNSTTSSIFYPTNLSGSWIRWWLASDNPTNITITNWVDRVFASNLTNTLALSPTNSSGGMGFNGSTSLKWQQPHAAAVYNPTNLVFMIVTPNTPSADFSGLFGMDDTSLYSGGRGIFTRTTVKYNWNDGVGTGDAGLFANGTTEDVIMMGPCSGATALIVYTNGVSSVSYTGGQLGRRYSLIGVNPSVGNYKGKILEILIGTNIPPTQVSLVISNLHWYGTNTYHYTP